jgi:hypothetical protein
MGSGVVDKRSSPPPPFIGGAGAKMGDHAALAHGRAEARAPQRVHMRV